VDKGKRWRGNVGHKTKAPGARLEEELSNMQFKGAPTTIDYSDRVDKTVKATHQHIMDNPCTIILSVAALAWVKLVDHDFELSHRQVMRKVQKAARTGESKPPENIRGVFVSL
jgi:hypothetical protein